MRKAPRRYCLWGAREPGGRVIPRTGSTWRWTLAALGLTGALVGAGLALSALAGSPAAVEPFVRPAPGNVVVSTTALADGGVMVTVLDVAQQRLAMYQADVRRGRLKLLAVRDISADMALMDYNNDPPLPRDIRARVEKGADALKPPPAPDAKEPSAAP